MVKILIISEPTPDQELFGFCLEALEVTKWKNGEIMYSVSAGLNTGHLPPKQLDSFLDGINLLASSAENKKVLLEKINTGEVIVYCR